MFVYTLRANTLKFFSIIGIALMFEGILSIISGAVFEKKKKTFLTEFNEEKE